MGVEAVLQMTSSVIAAIKAQKSGVQGSFIEGCIYGIVSALIYRSPLPALGRYYGWGVGYTLFRRFRRHLLRRRVLCLPGATRRPRALWPIAAHLPGQVTVVSQQREPVLKAHHKA
jgi:hypothetical protein